MDLNSRPAVTRTSGSCCAIPTSTNGIVCKYKDGGFTLLKWVGGSQSVIAGPLLVGTKYLGRIRVSLVGDEIVVSTYDRARYWTAGFTTPTATATATQHGLHVRGGADGNTDVGPRQYGL